MRAPTASTPVLLGDMVQPGTSEAAPYNHYSLLRTAHQGALYLFFVAAGSQSVEVAVGRI